ncbi:MAG TPA: hypothetical protein VGH74_00485, partial [Planctomycetaceae bacterium]
MARVLALTVPLFCLVVILPASTVLADDEAAEVASPSAEELAAGEKAIARLKKLGADVSLRALETPGPRYLQGLDRTLYSSRTKENRSTRQDVFVGLGPKWKGAEGDLALVGALSAFGPVHVTLFGAPAISPHDFAELELSVPLKSLRFQNVNDTMVLRLVGVPRAKHISFH